MDQHKDRVKLFVAVPTTGTVLDVQTYNLRELEKRYGDKIEFIYPKQCVRRMFHDSARNALVEEFLESDADILWFLDSDIAPPKHVLDLVTIHGSKWQAAGAPYPVFMEPVPGEGLQVVFTVYKGTSDKGMHPAAIPLSGTEFVDGIATGCLFIKREVFESLKKPYFEFKYDAESRQIAEGEDIGFCRKLSEQGIKFFIDYSMVCKHYKNVCLLDVNAYAITYSNRTLTNYDKLIKGQVAQLVASYTAKKDQPKSSIILPDQIFKV